MSRRTALAVAVTLATAGLISVLAALILATGTLAAGTPTAAPSMWIDTTPLPVSCVTFSTPRMVNPTDPFTGPTLPAGDYDVGYYTWDEYPLDQVPTRVTANQLNEQLGIGGQFSIDVVDSHPFGDARGVFPNPYTHPGGPVLVSHIGGDGPGSVSGTFTLCPRPVGEDPKMTTTTAPPAETTAPPAETVPPVETTVVPPVESTVPPSDSSVPTATTAPPAATTVPPADTTTATTVPPPTSSSSPGNVSVCDVDPDLCAPPPVPGPPPVPPGDEVPPTSNPATGIPPSTAVLDLDARRIPTTGGGFSPLIVLAAGVLLCTGLAFWFVTRPKGGAR